MRVPLKAGFAATVVGPLRSRVDVVAVVTGGGHRLAGDLDVGVPGTDGDPTVEPTSFVPTLMPIPRFTDAPMNAPGPGEMAGQAPFFDTGDGRNWPLHSTRIYARCYGRAASIEIEIDSDARGQTVTIPCDDKEHVVDGPGFLRTGTTMSMEGAPSGQAARLTHTVVVSTDQETAWRAVIVALTRWRRARR